MKIKNNSAHINQHSKAVYPANISFTNLNWRHIRKPGLVQTFVKKEVEIWQKRMLGVTIQPILMKLYTIAQVLLTKILARTNNWTGGDIGQQY